MRDTENMHLIYNLRQERHSPDRRMGLYAIFQKLCFLFILLLHSFHPAMSAETDASGLLFKTIQESIDSRTSLDLYNGSFRKMTDSFLVQFDISIWDTKTFGYIFRLVNEKQEETSLVFVSFRSNDSLYFDFNNEITNSSVHIPVSKKAMEKGKWLPVLIRFDLVNDEATITLEDKSFTCFHVGFHNPDSFRFIFGLYGTNLDVAAMALKNIIITNHANKSEEFPLNESRGNRVFNSQGKAKGYVKNPVWLINKHYEWESISEFTACLFAGITYNSKTGKIMVINPDSITEFDLNSRRPDTMKTMRIPFKIISGEAIYDSIKNCCYVYSLDDSIYRRLSFATINFDLQAHSVTSGYAKIGNRLHHHNVFLSENGQELYIFGGYGLYTYSNTFYKYNPTFDRWDSLVFTGDTIYPRFFAAAGKGINPNEIFLYGGFGNQSGKQEVGGKNLYDLYQVDLNGRIIKKLWEQKNIDEKFVPCGNLILNREKTYFYTLCYPHHIAKSELRLYKFSIKDGSYEIVSNAIPVRSEKIETEVFLFFDESLQEFIAVTREYISPEKSDIHIYSLYSPPVSLNQLNNTQYTQKKSNYRLATYIFLSFLIVSLGFLLFIRRNKRKKDCSVSLGNTDSKEEMRIPEEKNNIGKCNSLYVLGDFEAFDKDGKNIAYRFSSKIQSLLAIILLNQKAGDGIMTQKLTSDLWPDKEPKFAKNIRGVTVNHLRNILGDIRGIQLIHENSKWSFSTDDSFYCDYLHTLKILNEIPESKDSGALIQELAGLIKRGSLFRNTETDWIDDYKQKYESQLEQLFTRQLKIEYNQENFPNALNLSEALFVIDPLNEDALLITLRILEKSGKTEQSKNLYNRFTRRYKTTMGENYRVKNAFITTHLDLSTSKQGASKVK